MSWLFMSSGRTCGVFTEVIKSMQKSCSIHSDTAFDGHSEAIALQKQILLSNIKVKAIVGFGSIVPVTPSQFA